MRNTNNKEFMMGNEIVTRAALAAGAEVMFGYPITPTTEILESWIALSAVNHKKYLQTEDEMSAGFALIGACLAGKKAFTATAGPGNILMQDAFAMAEALRIPTVAIIQQRGGQSTSTVIYSQEEVTLTTKGGNGEGFRIVYSTAGLQDLYDYTIKAFDVAWRYRFPSFVLGDGYQGKMKGEVELRKPGKLTDAQPILLSKNRSADYYFPYYNKFTKTCLPNASFEGSVNFRNCLNMEEETRDIIESYAYDFEKYASEIEEFEIYRADDAEALIISHGIVSAASKVAIDRLRDKGFKIGLFRPITLSPFPKKDLNLLLKRVKSAAVIESALGQLYSLVKNDIDDESHCPIKKYYYPGIGITPEEIEHIWSNK